MFVMLGRRGTRRSAGDAGALDLRAHVSDSLAGLGQLAGEDIDSATVGHRSMAPSARDLQLRIDESERELTAFMDQLNAIWADRLGSTTQLRPFLMLPTRCWDTEHQRVLIETLGLTPAQQWNVLPLASDGDEEGALGLGRHPGGVTTGVVEIASGFVDETIAEMHVEFERATFSGDAVDSEALDAARNNARAEIIALARRIATSAVGDEVVDRSRTLFFDD